jgi:hypothetical protein
MFNVTINPQTEHDDYQCLPGQPTHCHFCSSKPYPGNSVDLFHVQKFWSVEQQSSFKGLNSPLLVEVSTEHVTAR